MVGERDVGSVRNDELALTPVGHAFRAMLKAFERDTGVSAPRWFVLSMVAEVDGLSQGDVCRRFDLDPSRVSRLARGLEDGGLIRRERNGRDNRAVRLHLTGEGRALVSEFPERRKRFDRRVSQAISDEEFRELRNLLGALTEAMKD